MFWDKRKSPNVLEKGRWCGPAQVVMMGNKSIAWITHMNRLLRCATDNLRQVSLREYHQRSPFHQQAEVEQLESMAKQLQARLQERSGLFQFSDLSAIDPGDHPQEEVEIPPSTVGTQSQIAMRQVSLNNLFLRT